MKTQDLGSAPLIPLLLRFSLPSMAGMLFAALYGVIDRAFVGQAAGVDGMAVLTVAFPIMMIGTCWGAVTGAGASTLVALKLGEKDSASAESVLNQALVLNVLLTLVLQVICWCSIDGLIHAFGAQAELVGPSRAFVSVTILGFLFQAVGLGMGLPIRSQGHAKTFMVLQSFGSFLTVIFCYVFVIQLQWGVQGSAWANVCAQFLTAVATILWHFTKASSLKLRMSLLRPRWQVFRDILEKGLPSLVQTAAASILYIVLNGIVIRLIGPLGLAIIGLLENLTLILFLPALGLVQGAQPVWGFNMGAGQFRRVRSVTTIAIVLTTTYAAVVLLFIQVFPRELVMLFTQNDEEFLRMASDALRIWFMLVPLGGLTLVMTFFFQSIGKPGPAMILALAKQLVFLLVFTVAFSVFWGWSGLIWAGPAIELGSFLIAGGLYFAHFAKPKEDAPQPSLAEV